MPLFPTAQFLIPMCSVYVFERDAHTGNLTGIAGSVLPSRNQPTAVLWLSQREDEL